MFRFFTSLRSRLILLVLLAILPALVLTLESGLKQHKQSAATVQAEMLRLVRIASGNQKQLIEGTHQLLITMAHLPQLSEKDPGACNTLLGDLREHYQSYASFLVANRAGEVVCSSPATSQPVDISDREWFQRVLQRRDFVVGGYQIGRISRVGVIVLSYPVLDQAGQVQAVVAAGLDLAWLNQLATSIELPPGSTITLIDSSGTILAHDPDPQKWVGREEASAPIIRTILAWQGEGTTQAIGVDGVERLYAFDSLGSTAELKPLYIFIGIPTQMAYQVANRELARSLILLGLVIIAAFGATWVISNFFFIRRINTLVGVTKRLASGDLSVRSNLSPGMGEIGQLADAFDKLGEALEQREIQLRQAQEKYGSLFNRVPVGLYRTTPHGQILDANPALVELLHFPDRASLLALNASDVHANPEDRQREQEWMEKEGVVRNYTLQLRCYDGTLIWARDTVRVVRDEHGQVLYYEGSLEDITERRLAEEALRELATRDDLTGLFNRREFLRLLDEEIERYQRHGRPVALAMLDIDHFKIVNDTHGHLVGDEVLRGFSRLLGHHLRLLDRPARYGGEEFAILLPETNAAEAFILAERIRRQVEGHPFEILQIGGQQIVIQITVTIGISEISSEAHSREALIAAADQALYEGKRQGRNRTMSAEAKTTRPVST